MKKIAYLFVACAFFGIIALSSCKTKTTPAAEEPVIEEPAPVIDTMAADTVVL